MPRRRSRLRPGDLAGPDNRPDGQTPLSATAGVSRQTLWQRGATRAGMNLEWKM